MYAASWTDEKNRGRTKGMGCVAGVSHASMGEIACVLGDGDLGIAVHAAHPWEESSNLKKGTKKTLCLCRCCNCIKKANGSTAPPQKEHPSPGRTTKRPQKSCATDLIRAETGVAGSKSSLRCKKNSTTAAATLTGSKAVRSSHTPRTQQRDSRCKARRSRRRATPCRSPPGISPWKA